MASKEDDLKLVRCTYSELKQLAETLEKPRRRTNKSLRTIPLNSARKTKETARDEAKTKVKGSTSSSKEREVLRQQNTLTDQPRKENDLPAEKASGSSKKKVVAKRATPKEQNRTANNKNGLIYTKRDTPEQTTTTHKTVRFDVQNTKESSGIEGDIKEYDRGLISPNRLLYDPTVSMDRPGSNSSITSVKNELCSNDELCETMERLHTNDGAPQDTPTIRQTPTSPKKVNKKLAESLLADISYLEADLDNLLSRRINSKEQLGLVTKLSCEVEEKCKALMLTDLYVFMTKEVYLILWRSGIYKVIEKLRALQKSSQDDAIWTSDLSCVLQEFLNSTSSFITSLITSLEDKHGFLLKGFLDAPNQYDICSRAVKMALLSCHHFMIFLGDIERYKQNLSSSKEWSVARSYYLKASKIAPRNGKPYNQLAVIAVYAKRRLDAVYYYVRSLSVSNPIMTAREKLHAIFDDVQRKVYDLHVRAEMERRSSSEENALAYNARGYSTHQNRSQGRRRHNSLSRGSVQERRTKEEGRHELWVFYQSGTRKEFLFTSNGLIKGQQSQKEISEKKEKSNSKISLNEISKQFEIFFLYCHAMLYSKIGIDRFLENHSKTLGLFRTLLRHPSSPAVRMKRLVEIMAINMFEIENLAHEDYDRLMEGTPLDLALNLACDMLSCLCKATSDVIKSSETTSDQGACHVPVLTNYVPAIKVWFDWMKMNISLLRSSSVSIKEECWNSIRLFLNNLNEILALKKSSPVTSGEIILTLPEDDHLNGFKLLAQASKPRSNVDSDEEKEMVCHLLRNDALQLIAKFLCEFEDLPLRFDESSHSYDVTDIMTNTTSEETGNEIDEDDIEDDVIIESIEDIDSDEELPSPVRELKAKKDALTKEILNKKQREEEAQAVLVEHSSKPTLVLEINPQYLVPDTNCFIDHLPGLQYIVESRYFTVVIPLVVINELDGLAKGFSATDIDEQQRADFVANQARAAIDFLEYRFSLSDSQMLALTSKGSVLSTIAFRSEEATAGRGINDDVILNCCTHYCDAKMDVVNKLATADQPFTIRRKVVLLTEDRNLRLKAHVQNIPVVAVPQFLEMIVP